MDTTKFAECMKSNMSKRKISTEDLSTMTGISVPRLKEYESGDFVAKSDEIFKISKAIDVPSIILMKGGGIVHYSSVDENGHRICKWDKN